MALVKPTQDEIAEREEVRRFLQQSKSTKFLEVSMKVVRECGRFPAILLAYLTELQAEYMHYGDSLNLREGKKWIPARSYAQIAIDQPLFPDGKTVSLAAQELEKAGYIFTESTGKFVEQGHKTGRKRDIATWWHVVMNTEAGKMSVSVDEVAEHGMTVALILAYWRNQPEAEGGYRKLSAVEIEKVLPMDEKTARRNLKAMLATGVLVKHESKAKLYTLGTGKPEVAPEPQKQPRVEPDSVEEADRAFAAKLKARFAKAAK